MILDSYSDIKNRAAVWIDRADLEVWMPEAIRLAEAQLNRRLADNVNMVVSQSWTFTSASKALPEEFGGLISLSSSTRRLEQKSIADFATLQATGGIPAFYSIHAGSCNIWPGPSESLELTAKYRIKLDLIELGSNWLVEQHPDAYLYGALSHIADMDRTETRGPKWRERFEEIIGEINTQANRLAYSGPLQVKSSGCA